MLGASIMLAAAGQVVGPNLVRVPEPVPVGATMRVRQLKPVAGPPGRAPFFRWIDTGRVRVTTVRPDGTAEVALLQSRVTPGDKVERD